ncbi:hypothetical protein SEVIR_2G426900v4 [Setaria viridis]|uniref:Cytochrome b561 domain-containing protein n=1 Tax=Setaria viridis TaxID=4556 RepID=A0A4U6W2N8_SETVI|nr:hypothetical protein SEVIR_2G426900v2 [Setaria viridis]
MKYRPPLASPDLTIRDLRQRSATKAAWRRATLLVARASHLYLTFQFVAARPAPYLICAVGPSGAQLSINYVVRHRSYASAAVDYATGVASNAGGAPSFDARKWHGAMAGLGWGALMPLGAALARYFKRRDPFWFYAHASVQGVGFVLGTAGSSPSSSWTAATATRRSASPSSPSATSRCWRSWCGRARGPR